MNSLKAYGSEVESIFQLLGDKENDITKSIAWVLYKCPLFIENLVNEVFNTDIRIGDTECLFQEYTHEKGITDLEITDRKSFYLIIEAKRGWILPGEEQLTKYSLRDSFVKMPVKNKAIITMSECSVEYANNNLPFDNVNGVPVKHLSWKKVHDLAEKSECKSNNYQKRLLRELCTYLGGIMTMQTKDSNWVYVVSLSYKRPEGCSISYKDIVNIKGKYFHPVGKRWPKQPPNYIAFRYNGKLQSIHHIDGYVVTKNIHEEVKEMPDEEKSDLHFVYSLGPAIKPSKEIKTGNIYRSARVWAMLDTLLTENTISEARDISKNR